MSALSGGLAALSDLGGLAGLAAVITAASTLRRSEARHAKARADDEARWITVTSELEPNHGSSLRDAVDRIEHAVDELREDHTDLARRLGHELGEIRRTMDREHGDYDSRIRALESRHR